MSRSRISTMIATAAAVVLTLALVGTADATPAAAPARTPTIIRGLSSYASSPHWTPNRVKVAPGTTIEWLGASGTHHLVAYGGNWTFDHALPTGTHVTRKFRRKGTFLFRCSIHSTVVNGVCQGMCGKIVVH